MARWLMLFVVVGFCFSLSSPVQAKRFALVIGNNDYDNISKLQKAENDAESVATALKKLNFKVFLHKNLNLRQFNAKFQRFLSQLNRGDDVLFFFAGHGVALQNNEYLLPTDTTNAGPGQEFLMKGESIPVHTILDALNYKGVRLSMLILDACRNNPFKKMGTRSLGTARGLGTINAPPEGTVIVYSAGRGETALDRLSDYDPDPNSVFTRTLIPLLNKPGLELSRLEKELKRKVKELAASVSHRQLPAVYNELVNDFYFIPPPAGQTQIVAPPQNFVNQPQVNPHSQGVCGEWPKISRTATHAQIEYFLGKCTTGVFAKMAQARLKVLKDKLGTKVAVIPPVVKDPVPEKPADQGSSEDAKRLFNKAWNLYNGRNGEQKNYYEAVKLYRQAADMGHASAKVNLGYAYENGHGVARDNYEAVRLYQEAAELGEAQGMTNLGFMYEQGKGIERNLKQAVYWYRRAAEANNYNGMTNLGYMYEMGRGTKKNFKEAVKWYKKAAAGNVARAQNNLAYMYLNGRGLKRNNKKAMELYQKSSDQNFPNAMYMIGYMHELGKGVPRNGKRAAPWVLKALKAGHDFSVKEMTTNANGWSAAFRKELQRLLSAEGYYHGPIDGAFGSGTDRAIKAVAGR